MQVKTFLAIAAIICLLYSCNSNPEKPRIKTRYNIHTMRIVEDAPSKLDTTYISGGLTTTNIYDDKGKLISRISSDGNKTVNVVVGDKIISTTSDSTGKVISTQTEFVNDKGQTDSFIVEKNGQVTDARKYIYDAQGNKIEDRTYELGGHQNKLRLAMVWKFNFKDSNVVSETLRFTATTDTIAMLNPVTLKWDTIIRHINQPETTTYYDYFMDKLNTAHGNTNSKNLIKRRVDLNAPGDTSDVQNFRYTFDDKGRVLTEVFESAPGYKDGATMQLEYDSTAYTYY